LSIAEVKNVGSRFTYATSKQKLLFRAPVGKDFALQVLRSKLRETLLQDVPIVWNRRLKSVREAGNGIEAVFEGDYSIQGDFLIGCDGSGSSVRECLRAMSDNASSVPTVVPSGIVGIAGHIPRTTEWNALLPLNHEGPVRFLGPGAHSLFVSFSESVDRIPTIMWGLSTYMNQSGLQELLGDGKIAGKQRLLTHCSQLMDLKSWHPALRKLVKDTAPDALLEPWILKTTQFGSDDHYPMLPSGRITLLGDAAHAMPPDLGLGGNNVLEDARLLASLLIEASRQQSIDFKALTLKYETETFARAKKAVAESEKAARMHNLSNPMAATIRNLALRTLNFSLAFAGMLSGKRH